MSNTQLIDQDQSSVDFVASLFDRDKPSFIFDDLFHFSIRHHEHHKAYKNMQPVAKLMLAKFAERLKGQDMPAMMIPEAITNGMLYFDLAKKHEARIRDVRGHLTTYRMAELLPGSELELLTEKNKNRAMARLEGFQNQFTDSLIVSPTGMEAFLKSIIHEPGFTNGQSLRDEDFEAFWVGVCYLCKQGGFADEVAYSRNGNFETFALFLTQYGVVPFRPDAETNVYFPDGQIVTPLDYLKILYDHMTDVVPRGFTADLTVKMAVRLMVLEDMRVNGYEHPHWGKLDLGKVNPELMRLRSNHNKEFKKLSDKVIAFMEEHDMSSQLGDLFGLDGNNEYDRLGEYYQTRVDAMNGKLPKIDLEAERAELTAWRQDRLSMERALAANDNLHDALIRTSYQLDGDFFDDKAALFDEGHFARCAKHEQIALKAYMGLRETPQNQKIAEGKFKGEIFVMFDRRGGSEAEKYMAEHGVLVPDEARGLVDSFSDANFDNIVKAKNIDNLNAAHEALKVKYPNRTIVTSEEIEHDADNLERNRDAIRERGAAKMSPQAKLAYQEEIIRRSVSHLVTDPVWANSASLTWARLHARKVQLGLLKRPDNIPPTGMLVGDYDDKKGIIPRSFLDDYRALSGEMKRHVEAGSENYPRHVVKGLMEMTVMAYVYYNMDKNKAANPKGREGLIDFQKVPLSFKAGLEDNKAEFIDLMREAKDMILHHGMEALSEDDVSGAVEQVDRDYLAAKQRQDADQSIVHSRDAKDRRYVRRSGVAGTSPR